MAQARERTRRHDPVDVTHPCSRAIRFPSTTSITIELYCHTGSARTVENEAWDMAAPIQLSRLSRTVVL